MKDGSAFTAVADSTGGGGLRFRFVDGHPVEMTGDYYYLTFEANDKAVCESLSAHGATKRNGSCWKIFLLPKGR